MGIYTRGTDQQALKSFRASSVPTTKGAVRHPRDFHQRCYAWNTHILTGIENCFIGHLVPLCSSFGESAHPLARIPQYAIGSPAQCQRNHTAVASRQRSNRC